MKKNKPFAVYYSGASAGCFFALTLALSSQSTHCISSTQSIQEIVRNNWNIHNVDEWDSYQVDYDYSYHPNDHIPRTIPDLVNNKLAIIKYDNTDRLIITDNAVSILIYTDVDTHFALMELKRRALFKVGKPYLLDDHTIISYNNVRDSLWPVVKNWTDLKELPIDIKDELVTVFNFHPEFDNKEYWMNKIKEELSFKHNEYRVLKAFNESIFNKVHHRFLLQDVIKTKFECVTDALNLEYTNEVQSHVDTWVALHPKKIQKMFYKDI